MNLVAQIKESAAKAIEDIYKIPAFADDVLVNQTKPEFEGDYTIVLFSFVKQLKASPEKLGQEIGSYLVNGNPLFTSFNVIKGFLNLTIADHYFAKHLIESFDKENRIAPAPAPQKIMVEYSSPNTNKPLHLGHLRNNFLGWSVAEILKASGNDIMKTCIVNDRGIHICKSMRAWSDFGNNRTPQSTGTKGDHFVGDFYVIAETNIKDQAKQIIQRVFEGDYSDFESWERPRMNELVLNYKDFSGQEKRQEDAKRILEEITELARKNSFYMKVCQQMLVDWENGQPEVMELWRTMNGWVYEGFNKTYSRIGSDFDKTYYESETYLLGKSFVEMGLEKGILYRKDDGSVWIDLTAEGLDEKLLLRRDGTSVYITQDLGLAQQKYEDYPYDQSIYVIGDEQNYHMKVLQLILQKLGMPYADGIYHLSYGMVELPSGRMKSREGTVVDADDLVEEMINIAAKHTQESGKVKDFTEDELKDLYETIGLGALKFFLLRVDPKKKMIFNPEESIDFHGFTGPFIQYTHARIKSILRREPVSGSLQPTDEGIQLLKLEKELLRLLEQYSTIVREAAAEHNPSVVAIYAFNVAKLYNAFYTEHSVLNAESEEKKQLRLRLCQLTANVIKSAMGLLGIRVPERM